MDTYTAFFKSSIIASGRKQDLRHVLGSYAQSDPSFLPLIFEDSTGRQIDLDLSSAEEDLPKATVGRPKLGVTAREITLLPRHWAWLDGQSGGASSRLRLLVESAMKDVPLRERVKQSQESCTRFLTAIAGNLPNYEDATRAIYRRDEEMFHRKTLDWPEDIRAHALKLAALAFGSE